MITSPSGLQYHDSTPGDGAEAAHGHSVTVHYTGWLYRPLAKDSRGKKFDSSVGRGPFDFPLGKGMVIKGWDQSLVGQKVGSRVLVSIPPELGYGSRGVPEAGIGGGDTLVFVVDIVDVR